MSKASVFNNRIKKFAYYNLEEVYREFNNRESGLKLEQVEEMKRLYGVNQIRGERKEIGLYRLRRAFINPFSVILFVLAGVSFITDVLLTEHKNPTSVMIIATMIGISGIIRLYQEVRAKRASEQLERLVHTTVTVRREGVLIHIAANEIVVGDIILLRAGDLIPADIRLIQTIDLFVSQAAITGESTLVEKQSKQYSYPDQLPLVQYENLGFMGTSVISGKGEGVVIAVGEQSLYGNFVGDSPETKSSFYEGAHSIAWVMIRFMAILVPIVFAISVLTKGNWLAAFVFSLSVAVGLMPEMLPMVITACLARGSLLMSKKQTIIKNINAMQGFGSMDVLCMDKTGTITQERILLEYYMDILGNESWEVLELAYLNSFYHSGVSNPIDQAILKYQEMPGKSQYFSDLTKQYSKGDEIPFDYNRKFVSTLVRKQADEPLLIIKGDIKEVVARCNKVEYEGKNVPITREAKESVAYVVDEMLEEGMKVIAVAKKYLHNQTTIGFEDEQEMVLIGYLAFFDAPKKSVAKSITALRNLNVKTKILTGDLEPIACSVCKRVGIETHNLLTGSRINELSDTQLLQVVEQTDVFVELTPSQKVRILLALKENGHTVGFLGDGMNDIPAICAADVGISVDTAVDAAKDLSDVVLLQKDLKVLEEGILEGRKTFINMLKYIKITASSNFGNILSIVCASAILPFLPMTAIQLLLLNLLYDALCIALPWDHVDVEECLMPQEWSGKTLGRFMLFFGSISSIFDFITFAFLYFILCPVLTGGVLFHQLTDPMLQLQSIAIFQTGWFLESMWTQVLILHMLRTRQTSFLESRSSLPMLLTTIIGVMVFTALSFTDLASVLSMTRLPMWYFIFLTGVVASYMGLTTWGKRIYIKKYQEFI